MKNDIVTTKDIEVLVRAFYEKVKQDDTIGVLFTQIFSVQWETHIARMVTFWENTIFHTGSYVGNPITSHRRIHGQHALTVAQFERWVHLFTATVDELFEGANAQLAKQRAKNIATVMQIKVLDEKG